MATVVDGGNYRFCSWQLPNNPIMMNICMGIAATRILRDLKRRNFVVIEDFDRENILPLASEIGCPIRNRRDDSYLKKIAPETLPNANPNTLSSRFGLASFPFHTDTAFLKVPARYLILYCLNPGSGLRPTYLIDQDALSLQLEERCSLKNEVWKIEQINQPFLAAMDFSNESQDSHLRFDTACMRPITRGAMTVQGLMQSKISKAEKIKIEWNTGTILVFDNYRMLHARGVSSVIDTDRSHIRMLVGGRE